MDSTQQAQVDAATERPAPADDAAALQRIRSGDTEAFALIMRRYNQRLYRVARSILRDDAEAQDAMQEAYVRAYFSLAQFAGPGRLGAWLTRITINEALMRKRRQRHHTRLGDAEDGRAGDQPTSAPNQDPEHSAANMQLRHMLEHAIDGLSEDFRTVFVLRASEQLSVRETAQCLGIPAATVKTRFHRARKLVQERLQRQLDAAHMQVFEFAGRRCDAMVHGVLGRLRSGGGASGGVH